MAARLDADATMVMVEARSLARRYQHDAVDLEHLLTAALTRRDGPPLSIDGVSRPELLARLEARLVAQPHSALYRDSARVIEPTMSPTVETTLRRAATGRGLTGFFRAITLKELFVALVMDPTLAVLVVEASIASDELEVLLGQARTLAVSRRHELVTVDHVLTVVLDASWFLTALRAVRADPSELRESLEARLAAEPHSTSGRRVQRSHDVDDVAHLARTTASRAGADAVGARHFVSPLLHGPHLAQAFVDAGVPLLPLLRYLASGHADAGADAPDTDGDLDVVFHNDDSTTMEFVVDVLTRCFDISEVRATKLMLDVHKRGERRIGSFAAVDARARVAQARARAEKAAMPLRISLRPSVEASDP